MSILVVQLVPEGLLFGADRNVTAQATLGDGTVMVAVQGQSQRPKVLKWPNREVIVGYVGEAALGGEPTDEWLYAFIGRHLNFTSLDDLAKALTAEIDASYRASGSDQPLIIHLGGFEQVANEWTPRVHFIRNTVSLTPTGAYVLGPTFDRSEELAQPNYFGGQTGSQIRAYVSTHFFSFRQGYDLGAFGVIDQKLREAMATIVHGHPSKPIQAPASLREWAKHVAFAIHGYGAYFAAFYPPFDQKVGGGADVVYAAWP